MKFWKFSLKKTKRQFLFCEITNIWNDLKGYKGFKIGTKISEIDTNWIIPCKRSEQGV
jgi:hypothetical protein